MKPAEMLHRLRERSKRFASRWHVPHFDVAMNAALPEIPGLRDDILAFAAAVPEARRAWRETATYVRDNRFRLLGVEWPATAGLPDWHRCPLSGRRWPLAYCFNIAYRHRLDIGDVKYVWELGRLQYLQPMAALAVAEDNSELAQVCVSHLRGWMAANPPFDGVHWSSGIELALRSTSFAIIASLLAEAFSAEDRRQLLGCLRAHGYWLARYPSLYSSANNHLVAEAGGLYLIGRLCPALPEAATWASQGRRILLEEINRQFHSDGIPAEQSPTYGAFTAEWMLLVAALGARTGDPFPASYLDRLSTVAAALSSFLDKGGHHPRIGDDDEGRVLVTNFGDEPYVLGVVAAIAAFLKRSDLTTPVTPPPHLRQVLFGRPPPPRVPKVGVHQFPSGGYTLVREATPSGELLLTFDHGPLGYLSIAAHGHADALALWLHLDGRPILVDAGTYLYHSGGAWRDHFRGTRAHNTLLLDDEDQSRPAGAFNWDLRCASRTP